jgi:hypothetical protein
MSQITRAKWRIEVERELELMGARVEQLATSVWRVVHGDSYLLLIDLADLKPSDLIRLAKS